ncbi:succinate dehydrogenase, hydrophobic membrane anchor protein [Methylocaldum sp. MU1018]
MNYRSPLARARGLGSAKLGTHEWWRQRVTSIALIPLIFWLAFAVVALPYADYQQVVRWIATPWNGILMLSFIIVAFYHATLGVQVVMEDYIHIDWLKMLGILGMKLVFAFLALASLYATLRIMFMG